MAKTQLEYGLGMDLGALDKAAVQVGKFGDETVRVLNRKFSTADVFKGLLQGLGIASVERIAEKMVEPFKESAESAQRIADWSDKAAAATERLLALRMSDAEQLAKMEKSAARIARELQAAIEKPATQKFLGFIERGSGLDKLFGFSRREDNAKAELIAQKDAELKEASATAEEKRAALKKKANDEEYRALVELSRADEERGNALRSLAEYDRERRREKMTDEQRINDLNKERNGVLKEIASYEKFIKEGGELTKLGAEELLEKKRKEEALQKRINELTKEKAKAEALIGDQVDSNIEKWKEFVGVINSVGRGDKDLSAAELARKIEQIKADIAAREFAVNNMAADSGLAASGGYNDILLGAQRSNLQQALAEQRMRERVKQEASFFGSDFAFRTNPGLSKQKVDAILSDTTGTQNAVDLLKQINDRLRGVLITVPATPGR